MAEKNSLNFSIIMLDDVPISIQYNYVVNQRNYNIQAGFNESLHKKISLDICTLDMRSKPALNNNYSAYDFLAGEGKNTQYKETADR